MSGAVEAGRDCRGLRVVVIGAGIAGVSTAHRLTVHHGVRDVIVVDEREPMSLTSRVGTQAYRNWWPGPDDTMVRFMNRSIDLLDELAARTGNAFGMNRRGYVFLTADPARIESFREQGRLLESLGAGSLREHEGGETYRASTGADGSRTGDGHPVEGADLVTSGAAVRAAFPFITPDVTAMLHARRCGWLDGAALGTRLIGEARHAGARLLRDCCIGFDVEAGRLRAVRLASGNRLECDACVLAPGPMLPAVARMLGLELPVFNELHAKLTLPDPERAVPPDTPLMVWCDPQRLEWTEAERRSLAAEPGAASLPGELPAGVHFRIRDREDSQTLLVIWTFHPPVEEPRFPPSFPAWMAETLARGVARMVPALQDRRGRTRAEWVDGGYYCKTRENRPLIGRLPVEGGYVVGALSGFGLMASQAAAELAAAHVAGTTLPKYAEAFSPDRYRSAEYQARLPALERAGGQL
jgi:glycine/D-amino acid oxidase-like deaminating enzyme